MVEKLLEVLNSRQENETLKLEFTKGTIKFLAESDKFEGGYLLMIANKNSPVAELDKDGDLKECFEAIEVSPEQQLDFCRGFLTMAANGLR